MGPTVNAVLSCCSIGPSTMSISRMRYGGGGFAAPATYAAPAVIYAAPQQQVVSYAGPQQQVVSYAAPQQQVVSYAAPQEPVVQYAAPQVQYAAQQQMSYAVEAPVTYAAPT